MANSINHRVAAALAALCLLAAAPGRDDRARDPQPTNVGSWFLQNDYPPDARRRREEGPVVFELTVDPQGKPAACRITQSSGYPSLDIATCQLVMERGTFEPALDSDGKPVTGRITKRVRWELSDDDTPEILAPWRSSSLLRIDRTGKVVSCVNQPTTGQTPEWGSDLCSTDDLGGEWALWARGGPGGPEIVAVVYEMSQYFAGDTPPVMAYRDARNRLAGRFTVTFTVEPDGKVHDCRVSENVPDGDASDFCEEPPGPYLPFKGSARKMVIESAVSIQRQ